jgi:hypothetical protein
VGLVKVILLKVLCCQFVSTYYSSELTKGRSMYVMTRRCSCFCDEQSVFMLCESQLGHASCSAVSQQTVCNLGVKLY